jgi:hypothetical protein
LPRAWAESYGPDVQSSDIQSSGTQNSNIQNSDVLPAGSVVKLKTGAPIVTEQTVAAGIRLTVQRGGTLLGQLNPLGKPLASSDFLSPGGSSLFQSIWITSHAAGGVPLGPYQAQDGVFVPELDPDRLKLVQGRPLAVWNAETLAFLPFAPGLMNDDLALKSFLPNLEGAFVAGAWLVQGGHAMSSRQILATGTSDLRTLRPRVFLGVTAAGESMLGVSKGPVNARQLALAAAEAGAQDAVLVY